MKKVVLLFVFLVSVLCARELDLSASVVSDNEKIISSRHMGFIKDIYISEGDMVKKGKLLYEIDSTEIDSKKAQAKLNINIYQNQFDNVKLNYERYKRLYKKGLVSRFDLEQMELKFKTIKNSLKIANERLKEINNQYQYLEIKAPNDGLIVKKSIKVGEMSIPGTPALIITDLSNLLIKTEVPESDLKYISVGKEVKVLIDSVDLKTIGKVKSIIPSPNPMTHTFTVKISFEKSEKLLPGMYAKVLMEIND